MPASVEIDQDALAFFNRLSGRLAIELTEPAARAAPHMLNLQAAPTARVQSVRFKVTRYDGDDFHDLTEAELSRVVLRAPSVSMCSGEAESVNVEHAAPSGGAFTVRDLIACVEETERQGRDQSVWLGGVDVHHVYFEGITLETSGVWWISWGS
jgi:hypothetical protein